MNCNYRNCTNDILNYRPNKLYCNKKCKSNEAKYLQREKNSYKAEKEKINKILDQLTVINSFDNNRAEKEQILDLYNKIYNK